MSAAIVHDSFNVEKMRVQSCTPGILKHLVKGIHYPLAVVKNSNKRNENGL